MALIHTGTYSIESLDVLHLPSFISYLLRNKQHFLLFEPCSPEYYYTEVYWRNLLSANSKVKSKELRYVIINGNNQVIGYICLDNICGYPRFSGTIGYSLDYSLWNKGIMTDLLSRLIAYLFLQMPLHRIQAAYMPSNAASGRVLEKLGFELIGLAKQYLFINGKWEDHILVSLISPSFKMPSLEAPLNCTNKGNI